MTDTIKQALNKLDEFLNSPEVAEYVELAKQADQHCDEGLECPSCKAKPLQSGEPK